MRRCSFLRGTPRPNAGSSSLTSKSGWFFRATSGSHQSDTPPHQPAGRHDQAHPTSGTQSSTDLNSDHQITSFQESPLGTPSKLVKRKSFGFVPIRRNKGPFNNNDGIHNDLPTDLEVQLALSESTKKQRPLSQQPSTAQSRHASYGGLGLGRAGGQRIPGSTDDLVEQLSRQSRRRSSRSRSRGPQGDDNEGTKGFMDNMRKISLVGKHKRTKSGASLASVGEALRRVSQEAATDTGLQHIADPSSLNRRSIPPPIELQPPSPARVCVGPNSIRTPNTSEQVDSLLSAATGTPNSARKTPSPTSKVTTSPQSASLGRSAVAPATTSNGMNNTVPRRNSLGDLKIPARISQAQVGLRRDLGMVREFAANVERKICISLPNDLFLIVP